MSWVIVMNSSFDSPETYYGKKVVHVQLMSVSFYVSCLALYSILQIFPNCRPPPGGAVVCIRDIFILTAWPSVPSLFIVSQSEQHVSASSVYYCLLRWLVKSKLAHLTFYFFHLPIPALASVSRPAETHPASYPMYTGGILPGVLAVFRCRNTLTLTLWHGWVNESQSSWTTQRDELHISRCVASSESWLVPSDWVLVIIQQCITTTTGCIRIEC
jgi:hypothetical protein